MPLNASDFVRRHSTQTLSMAELLKNQLVPRLTGGSHRGWQVGEVASLRNVAARAPLACNCVVNSEANEVRPMRL